MNISSKLKFKIGTAILLFFLAVAQACVKADVTSTQLKTTPTISSISTDTVFPTNTTFPQFATVDSSATSIIAYPTNGKLLLQFNNQNGEIWVASPPYSVFTSLVHDEKYAYSSPIWSHDGKIVAFVRSTVTRPVISTIWLMMIETGESRQIGPEVQEILPHSSEYQLLRTIKLLDWSSNNEQIAAYFYGEPSGIFFLKINSDTNQRFMPKNLITSVQSDLLDIANKLKWYSADQQGNNILFSFNEQISENTTSKWFLSSFSKPDDALELNKPDDTSNDLQIDYQYGHAWSPSGNTLLITDQYNNEDRLLALSLDTQVWEVVATRQTVSELPNIGRFGFVSWSPDGNWIAWWAITSYLDRDIYDIAFLESKTWNIVRESLGMHLGSAREAELGQWVDFDNGFYFQIWDPNISNGIYLLSPTNTLSDRLLIPFTTLSQQIPSAKFLSVGPWQP